MPKLPNLSLVGHLQPSTSLELIGSFRFVDTQGMSVRISFDLWTLPSGLRAICSRDRCNLNYSFFGLRLWPYEYQSAASLHKRRLVDARTEPRFGQQFNLSPFLNRPGIDYARSGDRCRRFRRLFWRTPRARRRRCSPARLPRS
jgi:hypothetical protein